MKKTILFILIFLTVPYFGFSADNFYVNLDEFIHEGNGKVKLSYTVTNGDSTAISFLDIELNRSLDFEKIELGDGLSKSGETSTSVKILTANKLQPGGTGQIKLIVRVRDIKRGNIFQLRKPAPAFIVTAYYLNGDKKTWSVYPPFIADMR